MTTKLNASRTHDVLKLIEEVSQLSDDEALSVHGIEIYAGGNVYDTVDCVEYPTVLLWAEAQISVMYDAAFEKRWSFKSQDD